MILSTITKLSEDNYNVSGFDENDEFDTVLKNAPPSNNIPPHDNEKDFENDFIKKLISLGYEHIKIHTPQELCINLKKQIEKLNSVTFNNSEWERFCKKYLINDNETFIDKTKFLQDDPRIYFKFDNDETKNIKLIDKKNYNNNFLQVINQYIPKTTKFNNRYDVVLLINGLPIVHIELKSYKVCIQQAFNQINRYQIESYADDFNKLFQWIQLFIISNEIETKYFSNTVHHLTINKNSEFELSSNDFQSNSSFAFTNFWADEKNQKIKNAFDFADTFLEKRTLQSIIFKYSVFTANNELKVMRPYQIAACQAILKKIKSIYTNYKNYESLKLPIDEETKKPIKPGGYIWHATGSGKTLTSFKTAALARTLDYIDKVIFVVDRKDLDNQTLLEYEKYGAKLIHDNNYRNETNNINVLTTKNSNKLLKFLINDNTDDKIIVTTIQKLSRVLKLNNNDKLSKEDKSELTELLKKRYVFILDECHRTTFGKMFSEIQKNFKYYYLFGFTGTPIFNENKKENNNALNGSETTEELFGKCLHSYTIYHALKDQKVLPFYVDWVKTYELKDNNKSSVSDKDILYQDERIQNNCQFILDNYDKLVKANKKNKTGSKFNAILAAKDIELAKLYYKKLQDLIHKTNNKSSLRKIAIIYTYEQNPDLEAVEPNFNTDDLPDTDKYFLDNAIKDYNNAFQANFSLSRFDEYYKNVSKNLKEQKLDLLIVVNMFLTGFDSPALNTIFIDKKLKYHELIQTYSRTNRILDSIKDQGNVINFQFYKEDQDEAYKLYSDKKDIALYFQTREYKDYLDGYDDENGHHQGLKEIVEEIKQYFPEPSKISLNSTEEKKKFANLITNYLRLFNKLSSFTDLDENELKKYSLNNENEYKGAYNNIKAEFKKKFEQGDNHIYDSVIFETKLIEINDIIDDNYILNLIKDFVTQINKKSEIENLVEEQKEDIQNVQTAREDIKTILLKISASPEYQNKQEAVQEFIESIGDTNLVDNNNLYDLLFDKFNKFKIEYVQKKLNEIVVNNNLNPDKTINLFKQWYKNQNTDFSGRDYQSLRLKQNISIFSKKDENYENDKIKIMKQLVEFYLEYLKWLEIWWKNLTL